MLPLLDSHKKVISVNKSAATATAFGFWQLWRVQFKSRLASCRVSAQLTEWEYAILIHTIKEVARKAPWRLLCVDYQLGGVSRVSRQWGNGDACHSDADGLVTAAARSRHIRQGHHPRSHRHRTNLLRDIHDWHIR